MYIYRLLYTHAVINNPEIGTLYDYYYDYKRPTISAHITQAMYDINNQSSF